MFVLLFDFVSVDSREIDKNREMPVEVMERLGKSTVFGLTSPKEYGKRVPNTLSLVVHLHVYVIVGGLGLGNKAYAKVCEVFGADWSTYSVFANQHDVIIYAIERYGNEDQKTRYLPKLISGQMTGALCIQEEGRYVQYSSVVIKVHVFMQYFLQFSIIC